MSTETGTSPPNPLPATPDQPTEEVKTMDQEALALVNKGERDETASAEKLPNQATLGSNTKGETENKQTEPPTVEVKDIDEDPAVDVPDQNKREEEKDSIPVSHTNTCPQPVAEALNSHAVEQQATESVVKEEVERPDVASLEKEQQKQTNTGGAPESSVEAIEMPQQQSEVLHVQESEDLNSQAVEQQATESVVKEEVERPDVASLEKEQQEQTNTGGAPESSVEAIEMPQQQSEVLHVQESEAVPAKDMEDSAVSKEVDKPKKIVAEFDQKVEEQSKINITAEVELKVEEQPEVNNQAELLEPVEPVEFLPVEKPEVVGEYSIEDSKTETKETDEPEPTVPQIRAKPDEHSEVTNQDEKTESVIPEVEVKQDRHKSSEQVESGSIEKETSKDEVMLACKVEDTTLGKEGKTSEQKESSAIAEPVISTNQNAQADVVEDKVGYSPAVVIEEDEKKETYGTEPVEVPSKVAVGEGEKIIEEEETKKNATEVNVQRDLLNEELAEPIKMEEVKNAVSNAEVSAKQFEGEIIGEVLEPVAKNEKDEIIIGGRSALVETGKDEKVELDVTAKNEKDVLEPVAENKKDEIIIGGRSALVETGKDEKVELDVTAKTNEDKLEKENIETVKSDVQNSEPSTKDGNDTKAPQDLPPEVPAKPPQKQSSNILTKVKQSLVKAKKAIIGKSPNPKTVSSNAKDDIKVK